MSDKATVKLSEIGMNFLDRFRTNRRKQGTDERDIPNWKLMEIIYQYLKDNNKTYKELLKTEWKKDV